MGTDVLQGKLDEILFDLVDQYDSLEIEERIRVAQLLSTDINRRRQHESRQQTREEKPGDEDLLTIMTDIAQNAAIRLQATPADTASDS